MIDLGPHAGFIQTAYASVAIVAVLLIGWIAWRSARVRARLAALEAQGIRRRSDGQAT